MNFDPTNKIVQLCAQGMILEGEGNVNEAKQLFLKAWAESINVFEKFTAAHYVARHQDSLNDKLTWDETALSFALKIRDPKMKTHFPSLYLNIGKCHEDLGDYNSATKYYQAALPYLQYLPDDGYGKMIKSGVLKGIERVSAL